VARGLAAAAILWPALLTTGAALRLADTTPALAAAIYVAAATVCHQKPDRSFHTHDVKWPVCGRCAGLYLAAPIGAVAALALRGQFRRRRDLTALALAASPTAVTFFAEHAGVLDVSTLVRFVAALPLGAALAWVIVRTAGDATGTIR
jgi:uncharacterized membrane protein